jgi:hypothetical protein
LILVGVGKFEIFGFVLILDRFHGVKIRRMMRNEWL